MNAPLPGQPMNPGQPVQPRPPGAPTPVAAKPPVAPVSASAATPAPTDTPVADTKPKRVRKAKEPKPEGEAGAPRPRLHKYADELIITVLKPGSKARAAKLRFDEYVTGMTVGEYVKKIEEKYKRTAGQTQADLRWDAVDHDFIHIGPTVIDVPPPPPPAPKPTPAPTTTPPAAA